MADTVVDSRSADDLPARVSTGSSDIVLFGGISDPSTQSNCQICSAVLGKRYFKPRHHCRICGRCVCQACSPNSMRFPLLKELQRVCIQCGDNAVNAPSLRSSLSRMSDRIRTLRSCTVVGRRSSGSEGASLNIKEEASAPRPIRSMSADHISGNLRLPSGPTMFTLRTPRDCPSSGNAAEKCPVNLDDAIVACENELGSLESQLAEAQVNIEIRAAFTRDLEARAVRAEAEVAKVQHSHTSSRHRAETASQRDMQQAQEEIYKARTEAAHEREARRQSESRLDFARIASLRLGQRIRNISGTPNCARPEATTLEEALALSEAALAPLEAARRRRVGDAPYDLLVVGPEEMETQSTRVGSDSPSQQSCSNASFTQRQRGEGRSASREVHGTRGRFRKRLLVVLALLLFGSTFLFAAYVWFLPVVLQISMSSAKVTAVSASISQMATDSVRLRSTWRIQHDSPWNPHIETFRVKVGFGGKDFGWCNVPALRVQTGTTVIKLDTELHITDAETFAVSVSRVLQGHADPWELTGSAQASLLRRKVSLRMPDTLHWPKTLQAMQQQDLMDLDILSGTEDELRFAAHAMTLISRSALQLENFGPVSASVSQDDIEIGWLTIPSFKLSTGTNIQSNVTVALQKNAKTEITLANVLGQWVSGAQQTLVLRIVSGASPSSRPLLELPISVRGRHKGLIQSALTSQDRSIVGFVPSTGDACSPMSGPDCFRGASVVATSLASRQVTLTDIVFDVDLRQELPYTVLLRGPAAGPLKRKHVACSQGKQLARLYSIAGMWSHYDPGRWQDADVTLPGAEQHAEELTSFYLPAGPQAGQSDGSQCFHGLYAGLSPYDCCFTTILPAVACYYKSHQLDFVPASIRGNFTLVVDSFRVHAHVEQDDFPIAFSEGVAGVESAPISYTCDDFMYRPTNSSAGHTFKSDPTNQGTKM